MKQYRLALLRKEFPFIDQLGLEISPEKVDNIVIKRGDRALLDKKGTEDYYSWPYGGHDDYTLHFAILRAGDKFEVIRLKHAFQGGNNGHELPSEEAGTIGEQLLELEINPSYIVECYKKDCDDNGNGTIEHYWVVYKMEQFDSVTYLQNQIDRAAAVLKAEIAATFAS